MILLRRFRKIWGPEIVLTVMILVFFIGLSGQIFTPGVPEKIFGPDQTVLIFILVAHLILMLSNALLAHVVACIEDKAVTDDVLKLFGAEIQLVRLYRVFLFFTAMQHAALLYLLFFSWNYVHAMILTAVVVISIITAHKTIILRGHIIQVVHDTVAKFKR